jgi:hypothetical protein
MKLFKIAAFSFHEGCGNLSTLVTRLWTFLPLGVNILGLFVPVERDLESMQDSRDTTMFQP